jgi:alkanesulfonate monooxygenase SsuD/methylene tetrahydromethanopterin reductase-like flavin-dependent oxidoreductase (luciferase family)
VAASPSGLGPGGTSRSTGPSAIPSTTAFARFDETLRILAPLVRGNTVTFDGTYHRADEAVLMPLRRSIPILIAAFRPRMLRLTARHADAWNTAWYGMPDDNLRRAFADMDAALDAEGRDPATLRRTVGIDTREPETNEGEGGVFVDDLPELFEAYEALGVDDVVLGFEAPDERSLDRLERVLRSR